MNLVKLMTKLKPRFYRVIKKLFGKNIKNQDESTGTVPVVNIEKTDKSYETSILVPGINIMGIEKGIDEGLLIIKSENQYSNVEINKYLYKKEASTCFLSTRI